MKRLKSYLFYIAMLSGILIFSTSVFAIEGEGTAALPFLITNQEELALIYDFPECHFKLMNDIELEGRWQSAGDTTFTGVFDGNGHIISNLTAYEGSALFPNNKGNIKKLTVATSDTGVYGGIIAIFNYGTISQCKTSGKVSRYSNFAGGIVGANYGTVSQCVSKATVSSHSTSESYAGGIAGMSKSGSKTDNCYFIGSVSGSGYSHSAYWGTDIYYAELSGISCDHSISEEKANINNCYAVPDFSGAGNYTHKYGVAYGAAISNCFYDKTVSGVSSTSYGTPKSTAAMKMKQTYINAGWDFENVWGISPNINDGYPYLLWEYPEENIGSAKVEISDVVTTDNSIKYISEATIEGEPDIDTFGTTFIPLQLLDNSKASAAVVQYNNAEYNISNGQTYGAALNNIPESCKDMYILGKSFIKDSNGNYTWSAAKYSSINDTLLHEAN